MQESDLPENKMCKAQADGVPVLVVRRGQRIFVMAEKCSHLGGPLSEGAFDGLTVTCPWHYSKFAIDNGRVLVGPATYQQPCFEVRVRRGQVEVRAPRGMVANPY
jgi:nitrite reductase/ring-hydroxylating ferredoxin subunit